MILIKNLDLVRADSLSTADAFLSVQTQINAQPSVLSQTQTTVGAAGSATAVPATPSGYVEIIISGVTYVLPFYAKE